MCNRFRKTTVYIYGTFPYAREYMTSEAFNKYLKRIRTDEKAFRAIYEYYLPKIKYHVLSKYGRSVDFEDVAHDAFTKLIRLEDPPEVENPTAWIYKICDNAANDQISARGGELPLDERVDASPPPSVKTLADAESESDYFSLVGKLERSDAEIVLLITFEGYNLKEAAEILGLSHVAARQKYSRALKKLKILLNGKR